MVPALLLLEIVGFSFLNADVKAFERLPWPEDCQDWRRSVHERFEDNLQGPLLRTVWDDPQNRNARVLINIVEMSFEQFPSGIPGGRRGGGGRRGRPYPGGQGRTQQGGGTVMYDSVFLASDEILRNQEGRKAIILIRMEWIMAARSRRRRRCSSGRCAGLFHPVLRLERLLRYL